MSRQHAQACALDHPWIRRIRLAHWMNAFAIGPAAPDDGVTAGGPADRSGFRHRPLGSKPLAQDEVVIRHGNGARIPARGTEARLAGLMAVTAVAGHRRHRRGTVQEQVEIGGDDLALCEHHVCRVWRQAEVNAPTLPHQGHIGTVSGWSCLGVAEGRVEPQSPHRTP